MEKHLFAIQNVETGKLNALVNNLMKQTGVNDPNEAIRLVNSGEWTLTGPACSWREVDGIIRFSVISDGTTGEEWIIRLEKNGFDVDRYAKTMLRSQDFQPTSGVTTEVAVFKGLLYPPARNIRSQAYKKRLSKPNAEVGCLIREKFTDKDLQGMVLQRIVVMHEPISDSYGSYGLLSICRGDDQCLIASEGQLDYKFGYGDAFAFVLASFKEPGYLKI